MRPKLRDDCTYTAVEDGVYLEAATGTAHITGRSAFALVDRLAGHLTGERSLEQITAALPEGHRRAVTELVNELVQRRLARDVDADPPHSLTADELDRYREEIAFAEHVANASAGRFEAFRTGRVLLVGSGATMAALLQSLYKLGLRAPALVTDPGDADTYRLILERCRADDPHRDLILLAQPDITEYDVVLHCSDRPMPARARELARAGRAAGVPVLHVFPLNGSAWVGPTGADACWECLWWNLRATAAEGSELHTALAGDDPDKVEPYLSAPLAALLGTKLAFAWFRQAVGAGQDDTRVVHIDLETAVTSEHAVTPHAHCGSACTRAAEPVDAGSFSAAAAALVDERLGPILYLGAGEHAQLPLNVVDVRLADPAASGKGPQTRTVVGATRSEALRRAATVGLETIGAAVSNIDPPVAGGFTWTEAQVRALLRWRHDSFDVVPPTGPDEDPGNGTWLDPAGWPAVTHPLAEDAAILGTQLYAWRAGTGTPTVLVGGDGVWLARACSVDVDTALTAAVQGALARLSGLSPAGCDIGVEPGAPVDWAAHLAVLLGEVSQVSIRQLDGGPAVRAALPFLAVASAAIP